MSLLDTLLEYSQESPQDPFNWYALATEYRKIDAQKALFFYEKVWREFPEYGANYYHLAELYTALGKIEVAQKVYEQGIEVLLAQKQLKLLQELKNIYQNFRIENDLE